jgi:hypothetical protein
MASRTSSTPLPEVPKESALARVSDPTPHLRFQNSRSFIHRDGRDLLSNSNVLQLLIAPITFVSLLLSLALIDNRNASLRHHIHAPSHSPAPDTLFGRVKNTLHNLVYRPQPYTYVKSPDIVQRQKSGEVVNKQTTKGEPWHWNTKQTKMMKMELADAFEMRTRVVLAMAVVVAVFAALVGWLVRWSIGMIVSYM